MAKKKKKPVKKIVPNKAREQSVSFGEALDKIIKGGKKKTTQ